MELKVEAPAFTHAHLVTSAAVVAISPASRTRGRADRSLLGSRRNVARSLYEAALLQTHGLNGSSAAWSSWRRASGCRRRRGRTRSSAAHLRRGRSAPFWPEAGPYPAPKGSAWAGPRASYLTPGVGGIRPTWRQAGRTKARFWIRSTIPSAMESKAPARASPKAKAHWSALNAERKSRRGDARPYPA